MDAGVLTGAGIVLTLAGIASMRCGPCHRRWGHSSRTRNRLEDEIEIAAAPPPSGERFNEQAERQRRATADMFRTIASPVTICAGIILTVNGITGTGSEPGDSPFDLPWLALLTLPPPYS